MKNNVALTGKIIALLSFVIGTILLSLYLYYGEKVVPIYLALIFVVGAIIINIVMVIVIIGRVILIESERIENIKTIAIMLINIPVSILYLYMVITFPGQNSLL